MEEIKHLYIFQGDQEEVVNYNNVHKETKDFENYLNISYSAFTL